MSKISILKSTTPEGRDVFVFLKDVPYHVLDESIMVKYIRSDVEIDEYVFAMDSGFFRGFMINWEDIVVWLLEPYNGDLNDIHENYIEDKWGFNIRLEKYLRVSPDGVLVDGNEEREKEIEEKSLTENWDWFYWFEMYYKILIEL